MNEKKILKSYTDADLLASMCNDDESAFTEIYYRYWDRMFYLACKKIHDIGEAENIVQEIFVDLWKRRATVQIEVLSKYMAAAVQYRILNYMARENRRRQYEKSLKRQVYLSETTTEDWLSFEELRSWLEDGIATLPEKARLAYHLREEGYSYAEIAQKMQISVKTVENHIMYALKKIRAKLSNLMSTIFFLL